MRALIDAAINLVMLRLRDFEVELQLHVLLEPEDPPKITADPQTAESWSRLSRLQSQSLAETQRDLFKYIPMPSTVPADVGFFLARGAGLSATRESHRQRFGLTVTRFSRWESEAYGEAPSRVAALPIPYAERLTPLRWPLLLHELGHHILPADDDARRSGQDDTETVIGSALGPDASAQASAEYREVLADRVAELHCGPAYAFALLRETILADVVPQARTGRPVEDDDTAAKEESTTKHTQESPSIRARLTMLDAWTHIDAIVPDAWRPILVEGNDEANLGPARAEAVRRMPARPDLEPRKGVVEAIIRLMRRDEPAGSVRVIDDPIPSALAGQPKEVVERAFLAAADLVVRDSELLAAAWTIDSCRHPEEYWKDLSTSLLRPHETGRPSELDADAVKEAIAVLALEDTAYSRGLQSIGVHKWLVEHDDQIRTDTSGLSTTPMATGPSLASLDGDVPERQSPPVPPLQPADAEVAAEKSPLADTQLLRRLNRKDDRRLVVRPLVDPSQVGGTTIDLRLGTEWEVLRTTRFQALDPSDPESTVNALLDASVEQFRLTSGQTQGLVLHPGELILALTLEYLKIPFDLWGNVEGRSTWARLGLQVHASAGMIDAGFNGYLTLELQNTSRLPMVLTPGLRVAQVALFNVQDVARPYMTKRGAAYSDQTTARTAFVEQHEHAALRRYLTSEREAEQLDLSALDARLAREVADR
jgi:dCTP deaminase